MVFPTKTIADGEYATAGWVDWNNNDVCTAPSETPSGDAWPPQEALSVLSVDAGQDFRGATRAWPPCVPLELAVQLVGVARDVHGGHSALESLPVAPYPTAKDDPDLFLGDGVQVATAVARIGGGD